MRHGRDKFAGQNKRAPRVSEHARLNKLLCRYKHLLRGSEQRQIEPTRALDLNIPRAVRSLHVQ